MRQVLVAVALLLALTDAQRADIRGVSDNLAQLDRLHEEARALCRGVDREIARLGATCQEEPLSSLCLTLARHRTHWSARCER